MKCINLIISAVIVGFIATSCHGPTVPPNARESGSAIITVRIGRVGSLAKRTDIEFAKLCVALSAAGEATVFDTIAISGNVSTKVTKTYEDLASLKTWTFIVNTLDSKDSTVHFGSTTFDVRPRQTENVSIDLPARFSMLKVNFAPIRDSVNRCDLLVNTISVDDSLFVKQVHLGDTIQLSFDYLETGKPCTIGMNVFGNYWNDDYLLYTADTTITPISGNDESFQLTLKWVGPTKPQPGDVSVSIAIGNIGFVYINGILEDANVEEGLVAFYKLNNHALDISGYGNDGAVWSAESYSDRHGYDNSAYRFINDFDSISIPHSSSLDITQSLTLSAWIKPINSNGVIISKYAPGNAGGQQGGYSLRLRNGKLSIALATGGYFIDYSGISDVTLNEYHFVAGTYDYNSNTIRVYLDGELEREASFNRTVLGSNTLSVIIGNRIDPSITQDGGNPFKGVIDGVRIYNRALLPSEIDLLRDFASW